MNEYEIVEQKRNIEDMIFEIRGKQVMLDSDLGYLFGCANGTKTINQAVKRNIDRFPEEFCFHLSENECMTMRSQFGTAYVVRQDKRNKKYLPYVFTEQGVVMLSSVLRTKVAIEMSIKITNAFVSMRRFISANMNVLARLDNHDKQLLDNKVKLLEHDNSINKLFSKLNNKTDVKEKIFFNGQIYDAYSLLVKIIKVARKDITIIDNYIDNTILDILSKKREKVDVLIVTDKNKCKLNSLDIEKFNKQYPTLSIKYNNNFHDRFIILDSKVLYHCGASIKDVGNKCFAISEIHGRIDLQSIIKETEL